MNKHEYLLAAFLLDCDSNVYVARVHFCGSNLLDSINSYTSISNQYTYQFAFYWLNWGIIHSAGADKLNVTDPDGLTAAGPSNSF